MAGRAKRCKNCREPLQEVLVYRNGLRRRTRVVQCPNHCDLKCPCCDEALRVTSTRAIGESVKCTNCDWKGHSPDREYLAIKAEAAERKLIAAQEKERETEREKIRSGIRVDELQVGSDCPFCGRELTVQTTVRRSEKWGYDDTTRRLTCGVVACDSIWWEETVTRRSEDLPKGFVLVGEHHENLKCESCNQVIRAGSFCGCS